MHIPQFDEIIEPNDQTQARQEHLQKLRELVGNVYPNRFERSRITGDEDMISRLVSFDEVAKHIPQLAEGERPSQEVKDAANAELKKFGNVRIAGRLATPPRLMGKAAFVHLSDGMSRLQIYVRRDDVQGVFNGKHGSEPPAVAGGSSQPDVNGWELFSLLDHGDFIGVEGFLFITNTGELSVHVEKLQFLAKAMLPMPDKMHGIEDAEIKQRQRYVDLIGSSLAVGNEGMTTRQVFEARAKVISSVRRFLEDHGYIEVETPMLTPKATGAAAKPFKTHHNALDIDLYARIAPELYLKRLVVGGFEKVYELNRNFRNEGISYKHNPEFTMLEFYCAYMNVNGMMDFCEELLNFAFMKAQGKTYDDDLSVVFEDKVLHLGRFERMTMAEAVSEFYPREWLIESDIQLATESLNDLGLLRRLAIYNEIEVNEFNKIGVSGWSEKELADDERRVRLQIKQERPKYWEKTKIFEFSNPTSDELARLGFPEPFWAKYFTGLLGDLQDKTMDRAVLLTKLFEMYAEKRLIQPTFITDYPKSISPLSKASPDDPRIAERFELFINGMEVANGFSELNDPREQYDRFIDQMAERERGDEEAMVLDEDYIRALSYGMPPTAGIGIGIDRLTMLLTNRHSIRDVILFPHMRPEKREGETGREGEGEAE